MAYFILSSGRAVLFMNFSDVIRACLLCGMMVCLLIISGAGIAQANSSTRAAEEKASVPVSQDQVRLEGSKEFIDGLAQKAISFLENPLLTQEQRRAAFRDLLIDRFDMKTLARFSMGRYWRQTTKAQKSEYFKLFEEMIIEVYSRRFDEYKGQSINVSKARPEGSSDIIVTSYLGQTDGSEIQIDWRVRYKDQRYRVVDVIVEGVSMAMTQRSDFASVIQRGGGQVHVLISHLRQ